MLFNTKLSGYSVRFSPYFPDKIAVGTAQYFGIVGNGRQSILQITPDGLQEIWGCDTEHGVFDCCWSETRDNVLVSACTDGGLKIWDTHAPPEANPMKIFTEHNKEVSSVNWNLGRQDVFLTSSWDNTVKLWTMERVTSISTFMGHVYCVYMASWTAGSANVFASVSGDHTAKVWDTRQPAPSVSFKAHDAEILCIDWCKYHDCVLATGGADKIIRTWDVRALDKPITELRGHRYAVRKVLFSPHAENLVLSCSYDMTVRLWDVSSGVEDSLLKVWDHHTEFAVGIDFSDRNQGQIASTGWDELVYVWDQEGDPRG
ncbi:hypothetical protein BSKO_11399 [Bryopsis sp. KO-2023]|nr:hypothetical protein BSKO_11399 [Bryopsis sp. KO-2023]